MKISPSLMCMDFLHIEQEINKLSKYADELHVDILDWHYCKNLCLSPTIMKSISTITSVPMEAHLYMDMIELDLIELLVESGAKIITMPPEIISRNMFQLKQYFDKHHIQFGVFLNPSIPIESILPYGHILDRLIIMSVDPGFAGQSFIETTYKRVSLAKQLRQQYNWHYEIEMDGCCNEKYFKKLYESGADIFVLGGSGLFSKSRDTEEAIKIACRNVALAIQ